MTPRLSAAQTRALKAVAEGRVAGTFIGSPQSRNCYGALVGCGDTQLKWLVSRDLVRAGSRRSPATSWNEYAANVELTLRVVVFSKRKKNGRLRL